MCSGPFPCSHCPRRAASALSGQVCGGPRRLPTPTAPARQRHGVWGDELLLCQADACATTADLTHLVKSSALFPGQAPFPCWRVKEVLQEVKASHQEEEQSPQACGVPRVTCPSGPLLHPASKKGRRPPMPGVLSQRLEAPETCDHQGTNAAPLSRSRTCFSATCQHSLASLTYLLSLQPTVAGTANTDRELLGTRPPSDTERPMVTAWRGIRTFLALRTSETRYILLPTTEDALACAEWEVQEDHSQSRLFSGLTALNVPSF
ncbi:uncharacterized protein LOC123593638 isoform X1 [Leopardus geoffroyi]|uniref:uncharacterized protein LOC123593638 isoform X1 n=1 Tax=Leopardus geoffroyi TaxID=46844 RepID=UPI001E25F46C|nr:uncharacterized protein LOC123593638 isoform X1 [Leopardus geoffroyi]